MSDRRFVISLRGSLAAAALMIVASATQAQAQDWFLHPHGDLRAYHGDWLAVCDNGGAGPCRAVQTMMEPGETRVGPARLALERQDGGRIDAVFHHFALMEGVHDPITIDIDGSALTLSPEQWAPGEPGRPMVIAAFHIDDPTLVVDLVERMKAGARLTLRHHAGEARFSLRGVTAALDAIDARADKPNR